MNKPLAAMTISKDESYAIKGFAIVLIVMHNLLHYITDIHENEFTFDFARWRVFLERLTVTPLTAIIAYMGWMGVSLFVFMSGYGLETKYAGASRLGFSWLKGHYTKLLLLLFPAMFVFTLYVSFTYSYGIIDYIYLCLQQMLLLNVLNYNAIQPGVYWYLGIAIQFYVLFFFIRKLRVRWLMLILFLCYALTAFSPDEVMRYMRHNCIGWMPEFLGG